MEIVNKHRTIASTEMNASRSHTIITEIVLLNSFLV